MRSELVDQLLANYLRMPVKATWEGGSSSLLRGTFENTRLELAGVATAWLPLESVVLAARRVEFQPGVPANIRVEEPRLVAIVGQRDVEKWLAATMLPFTLDLCERGILARASVGGLSVGEIEVGLDVRGGWFVLKPRRASVLGIPNYVAWLFRTYLPLPPLAAGARLDGVEHERGRLGLVFELEDFDEHLTPGLLGRLRRRIVP